MSKLLFIFVWLTLICLTVALPIIFGPISGGIMVFGLWYIWRRYTR